MKSRERNAAGRSERERDHCQAKKESKTDAGGDKKSSTMKEDLPLVLDQPIHPPILDGEQNTYVNICGRITFTDDGTVVQNHALYSTDPQSVKIILYYDDVEVTNEQTRRKHKLVMFYFKLANLYPDLKSINFLAIVEYQLLTTHGMDNILAPFIEELKTLGRDTGVDLEIRGGVVRLRGALLAVIADTPASQLLGVCWSDEKEMSPFA
ncbi:hypothetical protein ACROYT_G014981 [Oculina patagonica]